MFQYIILISPIDVLEGLRDILIKDDLEVVAWEDSWGYNCSANCDIRRELWGIAVVDLMHTSSIALNRYYTSHLKFEFPNVYLL